MFLPAWAASTTIAVAIAIAAPVSTARTAAAAIASVVSAFGTWPCFVHGDGSSAEVGAVERLNCGVRLGAVGHFYKSKSTKSSAELIADEIDLAYCSIFAKSLSEIVFTGTEGKISYVDIQARRPSFREKSSCVGPCVSNQTQAGAALEEDSLTGAAT